MTFQEPLFHLKLDFSEKILKAPEIEPLKQRKMCIYVISKFRRFALS